MSVNPRYAAYARAHGKSPDEMMASDEREWPGGVMCGFILWIGRQKQAFLKAHPEAFLDRWIIFDHEAWDAWLEATPSRPH